MTTIRRIAYAVLGIALAHLVFGAIVRITGSGMGCGPHWPKCYGRWFPPMDQPALVIEVMHRYLASVLLLALVVLVVAALRRRGDAGVGGPGGVLRAAVLGLGLGLAAALLGAVTVKLGNSAPATVGHWTVAMTLIAAVTAAVIRAGGFGGGSARLGGATAKARRGGAAAAVLALAAVVLGGLTAKVEGGSVACLSFPLCGANPAVPAGAVHVQGAHRVLAVLLVLHLVGLFFALRKRGEPPVVRRAATIALGLGVAQLLIAGAMIGMRLPPVLRSLHEATGVSIWIATFALAYLARLASTDGGGPRAATGAPVPTPAAPPGEGPVPAAGPVRVPTEAHAALSATLALSPRARAARTPAGSTAPVHAAVSGAASKDVAAAGAGSGAVEGTVRAVAAITPAAPVAAAVVVAGLAPARHRADEPIELPAARQHALRIVAASAIALQQLSASASAVAVAVAVAVAAETHREVAAPVVERGEVASLAEGGAAAAVRAVEVSAAVAAVAAVIVPADAVAEDGLAAGGLAKHEIVELAIAGVATAPAVVVGAPPDEEGAAADDLDRHRADARRTIFDEADDAAALNAPGPAGFDGRHDLDTRDAERGTDPDVESLDDEFNRPVIAAELARLDAGAREPVASPLRRPSMQHSVAVIIARGADF
jgi:cytochrome c oxidase assembly protein subunit 15